MKTGAAVTEARRGRRIRIRGVVQGVGFRPWVYRLAHSAGVTGRVHNDSSGVTIDAFGADETLGRFVAALTAKAPAAASIAQLTCSDIPVEEVGGFSIVESEAAAERCVSIPPDLATCDDCAAEIFDPANRRYRYPFTNCTNCGPRLTIATDIPYDRATTTMAVFRMCEACGREYGDVSNRRFHAQPNACPACGPMLTCHLSDGTQVVGEDALVAAAAVIARGGIVAVKGIGGFHLACDATSAAAVAVLRLRKHRDEKPFAVMVRDLAAAETIADVDDEGRRLLTSVERPIVLLPAREGSRIASNVSPRNRMVGVVLPYSPLHHILLADAGRPLVMTSGNVSDEPVAFENSDALTRLTPIADAILTHDRSIQTRCDDSVMGIVHGRGVVFRRSRGFVPRAVTLRRPADRPVLACGAALKNTFCITSGDNAWLGPHIGDLENLETYESFRDAIVRMERFLQVRPEVVAHDLHPDYLSTQYATLRPEAVKVAVQHHHAHVVSAMAEHGIAGEAIGIAYDGTGYGTDGTMWGGEILIARAASFVRAATFRPVALAGGDLAIREPWRIALAMLIDAFGDIPVKAAALLGHIDSRSLGVAETLIRQRVNAPLARGVGRYFDGFGALVLRATQASFEGQLALEWNQAATGQVETIYPYSIDGGPALLEIDLRPMIRAVVADITSGVDAAAIADGFHNTIAAATADAVRRIAARVGRLPVVASGGCLQNALLAERIVTSLAPEHEVLLNGLVPPGDGGIALGQAIVADAVARGEV